MTERELQVLELLKDNPEMTQKEVADRLGITCSTVSVHISNLSSQGYIRGQKYIFSDDYVVCAGTSNVDIAAFASSTIVSADKNPQSVVKISAGGVARNIAENIARMGLNVKMLTSVGDDANGEVILSSGKNSGIDMRHIKIVPDETTAVYISLIQPNGDVDVGITSMHIVNYLTPEYFAQNKELITQARALVITPCLPEASLNYIKDNFQSIPVFLDMVAGAFAPVVLKYLPMIHTLKLNELEAEELTGINPKSEGGLDKCTDWILSRGVCRVFITLGKDGVFYKDDKGNSQFNEALQVKNFVSATGAGDAFAAGTVYSFINRFDVEKTLKFSSAASAFAVSHENAINNDISANKILEAIKSKD